MDGFFRDEVIRLLEMAVMYLDLAAVTCGSVGESDLEESINSVNEDCESVKAVAVLTD